MKKLLMSILILAFFVVAAIGASAAEIAVIVNSSNKVGSLSDKDLEQIYKGRKSDWASGRSIVVINRDSRSDVRKEFYSKALRSKPTEKFFLPGSPVPFRTVVQKSPQGVIKFVGSEERAIGYVYRSDLRGNEPGIKILKTLP